MALTNIRTDKIISFPRKRLYQRRQAINAETADWVARVVANGGTVSQSTASAVSAMCDAIESSGIRDRFYRLNLFCGSNLNAALVPLYRGPSYSPDGLGAELWSVSTPSITDASGSNGSWDGSTLTMTNTGTGTDGSFPRFAFSLPLTTGKRYAVSGTLTGDKSAVAYIRLASSGSLTDISYNSTTGVFSATAATASAAHIQFLMNATLGTKSVTISSVSIREVLTYGNATDTNNAFVGVGTDYAETGASGGLTGNGSTKHLDTGLAHTYPPTNGDRHIAVYKNTTAGGVKYFLGTFASAAPATSYRLQAASSLLGHYSGGTNNLLTASDDVGFWHGNGTVTNVLYKNGSQVATNGTGSDTVNASALPFFIFAVNADGTATSRASERLSGYSIGLSMDATQAAAYYTAMQAFQTALGRNV